MKKIIILLAISLMVFVGTISSGYAFIPLFPNSMNIQQTTQGFCIIKNQTNSIVRCGVGNATLTITHGSGITVKMFDINSTMWINGTGSPGATGPQGPQG